MKQPLLIGFLVFAFSFSAQAQVFFQKLSKGPVDSNYYSPLNERITVKAFSAQKFSDFSINDNANSLSLNYNSNPTRAIGLGFSYKWLGLNLGYGFSFANTDQDKLGETKRIDLLTHVHWRKLTLNIYTSWYQGFYLSNSNQVLSNYYFPDHFYTRKDIKQNTFGVSGTYIFNSKRYSNKAVFMQNEWQKKTAGSFVAGGSIFYNGILADSSMIPSSIINTEFFNGMDINQSGYFGVGGHVGYTLALILNEHWFVNFSLMGGFSLGQNNLYVSNGGKESAFKLNLNLINDMGFGYNSEKWYAGFTFSSYNASSATAIEDMSFGFSSGKYQFVLAYRIKVNETMQFPNWLPFKL